MVMVKGEVPSTQKRKGREYKEVSRLAEKASRQREEKQTLAVCADWLWIQPCGFNIRRENPSSLSPHLWCRVRDSQGCQVAGWSVGGIRVNASRAFCGGGHWRRSCSILPTSISLRWTKRILSVTMTHKGLQPQRLPSRGSPSSTHLGRLPRITIGLLGKPC